MKQYAILITTVIFATAYTAKLPLETTLETLTDSSNTTQKNVKFETRNKKFGERLKAAESPVITATESLVTTVVPTVTTQTEPKVLTTTEPPVTTKNESLLTNTAEQQMTTEIEQLVSTATEPPVITKVESLLITTAEPQMTTEPEPLVSTATTTPPVITKVESLMITTVGPQMTTETEQLVSTATEPPVITKVESLLITTAEQQITTEIKQLVSIATEPPVRTKVVSLLITTAEEQMTTETKPLVSTATEPPVITKVESLLITTAEEQMTTETEPLVSTASELPVTTSEVVNSTPKMFPLLNDTLDERPQTLEPVTSATESSMITTTEFNPCLAEIEMPDFSAPGRRISEQKCKEYIWNIKYRELEINKTLECGRYEAAHCEHPISAVVGGRVAHPLEFPHMGALGWKAVDADWLFKCGSSLISEKFLLTAAHCSAATTKDVTDPVPKIVKFGVIDLTKDDPQNDKSTYEIAKIIVHPKYHGPKRYFDIAIIELKTYVYFNANIHPACLWTSSDVSSLGPDAFVTGWGALVVDFQFRSEYSSFTFNQQLQVGKIQFIDSQTCDELMEPHQNRRWRGLKEHQICAANLSGGIDACQGDSGGPLQVPIPLPDEKHEKMNYIVGVTSFGKYCAQKDTAGIYTRVSSFIDWIEDIVWPQ